jgi:hypothetical protein
MIKVHLGVGAVVGAVVALWALDLPFIAGSGGKWLRPENDFNAYLVAWHYFTADSWRWPLFVVPHMGYPEGSNVVFSDVLPITALATKAFYSLTGVSVMPFGWWIFATYVLQGAMAARLAAAVGARSLWASAGAATFAVCCIAFMWRLGHTALSSHFVILWALAVYFESAKRGSLRAIEISVLCAVTILINSYLFAMIVVLAAATVVELARQRRLSRTDLAVLAVGALVTAGLAIVEGYGVLLADPRSMRSGGLGMYSWNLVTLLVPLEGLWQFPRGVVRDATGGQYEGESYIGLGAVLMLLVVAVVEWRAIVSGVRRHGVFVAALALLTAAAASNRVFLANVLLVEYPLPDLIENVGSSFRATGRFIWPLAYTIMVVPTAMTFRSWRPALAIPLLAAALVLQVKEAIPTTRSVRASTRQSQPDMVESGRLNDWMRNHSRLWQFPSWGCGGLAGSARVWGGQEANRELQVQLAAARLNMPTNSVYTSRVFKDCGREAAWGQAPTLDEGVLYLLGREAVSTSAPLTSLVASSECVDVGWAFACSRKWAKDGSSGRSSFSDTVPADRATGRPGSPSQPAPRSAAPDGGVGVAVAVVVGGHAGVAEAEDE